MSMSPLEIARMALGVTEEEPQEEAQGPLSAQEIAMEALGGGGGEQQVETQQEPLEQEQEMYPQAKAIGKQFLDELVDIPKQVGVSLLTAPAGIPKALIEAIQIPGKLATEPKETLKALTGIDFPIDPKEVRDERRRKLMEEGGKKLFGEEKYRELVERNEETQKNFKEKSAAFYDILKKATAETIGQPLSDTIFKGLIEEGSPYFVRALENTFGTEVGSLDPSTPGGQLVRTFSDAMIQQRGLGIPAKASGVLAGAAAAEEAGVPEYIAKPAGLLGAALSGAFGKKTAKPTTSQTIEMLKADSAFNKILLPNIKMLEEAKALGIDLPPYMVGRGAIIDSALHSVSKSPFSKRKFENSVRSIGEGLEVVFQEVLDSTAERSFEGPGAAQEALRSAPRERAETAQKSRERAFQDKQALVMQQAEALEVQGMEAKKAVTAAEEQIAQTEARLASNEIAFENPAQTFEKAISDRPLRTKTQMGEAIQGQLDRIVEQQKIIDRALYDRQRQLAPNESLIFEGAAEQMQQALDILDTPGSKSAATSQTIRTLKQNLEALRTEDGTPRGRTIAEGVNMKTELGQIINYDVVGTTRQFLKESVKAIEENLSQYKEAYPEWWAAYQEANRSFEKSAPTLRNETIRGARHGRPETISTTAQTPSAFLQMETALNLAEDGYGLSQELKRQVVRDILGPEITEASNLGDVSNLTKATKKEALFQISDILNSTEQDVLRNTQNLTERLKAENLDLETYRKSVEKDLLEAKKTQQSIEGEKKSLKSIEPPSRLSPLTIEMLNSKNGIKKLRGELNSTKNGRELMKSLERFKLEEMLGEGLFNEQGELQLNKISDAINNRNKRELIKMILDEKAFKDLSSIGNISTKLLERAKQVSKNHGRSFPGGFFLSRLLTGNAVDAFALLGLKQGAKTMTVNFLTDPKNLELLGKLGREKNKVKQIEHYKKLTENAKRLVANKVTRKDEE